MHENKSHGFYYSLFEIFLVLFIFVLKGKFYERIFFYEEKVYQIKFSINYKRNLCKKVAVCWVIEKTLHV